MKNGSLLPYFTISEIAALSGMSENQILRLGISGAIRLSVLEAKPANYEETEEQENPDGTKALIRRKNEIALHLGSKSPALQLYYIAPEDIANVVANEAPNRKTLIRELYETRDLIKKKGKLLLTCPLKIATADICVSQEEWGLFKKTNGKLALMQNPLNFPEKLTLPWLLRNVPISMLLKFFAILGATFLLGIGTAETSFYQSIKSEVSAEAPNSIYGLSPQMVSKAFPTLSSVRLHSYIRPSLGVTARATL